MPPQPQTHTNNAGPFHTLFCFYFLTSFILPSEKQRLKMVASFSITLSYTFFFLLHGGYAE